MTRPDPDLRGTITCPRCHVASRHSMPDDACQFFLACPACDTVMRPAPGDCCVFCSHGDRGCPSAHGAAGS
ncbi:MAG: GDCCVxC domain-containing (seleno)protein [Gemmatimonadales bacterium]